MQQLLSVHLIETTVELLRRGQRIGEIGIVIAGPHLREEPPAITVTVEVIDAQVGRHRLQPAARRLAGRKVTKGLVRLQEHRLRDVLGISLVSQHPHCGAVNHVLVVLHEHLKLFQFSHRCPDRSGAFYEHNTARDEKVAKNFARQFIGPHSVGLIEAWRFRHGPI